MLNATFNPAQLKDCRWLWQLRQHPRVAEQSLSTGFIPYKIHCRWYKQLLTSQQRQLDIFTDTITAERLGFIRSEPFENGLILSWAIVPELHGQGIGKAMLERWCSQTQQTLWAQIKSTNTASKSIATQVGFCKNDSQADVELWRRDVPNIPY